MIIYNYSPKHTRIKLHFEPIQTYSVSPFIQINDFNKKAHDFVCHVIIAVGEHVAGWWRVVYRMDTAIAVVLFLELGVFSNLSLATMDSSTYCIKSMVISQQRLDLCPTVVQYK